MVVRRITGLGPSQIETDNSQPGKRNCGVGDFLGVGLVPERGGDAIDDDSGVSACAAESVEHGFDGILACQPVEGMQGWAEAHLGVHHAVRRQVDAGLVGDPADRVLVLHHAEGVFERLEISLQRP